MTISIPKGLTAVTVSYCVNNAVVLGRTSPWRPPGLNKVQECG